MRNDLPLFIQMLTHSLLSFVICNVYCTVNSYRADREFMNSNYSVRYSTTFKEALRGISAASNDKDSRKNPYMESGTHPPEWTIHCSL